MNTKNSSIVIVLSIATLSLNSCSLFKCEAEGLAILKNASIRPSHKHSKSVTEIIAIIQSDDTINEVKNSLSKKANYYGYLSDRNFANFFQLEEIKSIGVLSFKYKHSDPDFASAVVNTWMDVAFLKTKKTYTPEIPDLKQKYEQMFETVSSNEIIDAAFDYFNEVDDNKSKNYTSKEDFAKGFKIEKNINKSVINITYLHSDTEVADRAMQALFEAISISRSRLIVIDRYADSEIFYFYRTIVNGKLQSIQIGILDKSTGSLKFIQLADKKCDRPISNNIKTPLKIFRK